MIPAYKPDEKLVEYVERLVSNGFKSIIVINDGSGDAFDSFFEQCSAFSQCTILRHEVNQGKGRALKTGMEYYLEHFEGHDGIVTGDADGQHTIEDTIKLAELLSQRQDALLLGSRDFGGNDIPARSRFGNRLTSLVFKLTHGVWLGDTQTGLRGIPDAMVRLFSTVEGERYEYEMNMLIECADRKIPIVEQTIQTVYIDDNSSSHFNPIRDSIRIYWLILKNIILYICSSLAAFIVEFVMLLLLEKLLLPRIAPNISDAKLLRFVSILCEGGIARGISSLVNFFINKIIVFRKKGHTASSMGKYIALVIGNYLVSYCIVGTISTLFGHEPFWVAPIVSVVMVIFTYTLQKIWVFKKDKTE